MRSGVHPIRIREFTVMVITFYFEFSLNYFHNWTHINKAKEPCDKERASCFDANSC